MAVVAVAMGAVPPGVAAGAGGREPAAVVHGQPAPVGTGSLRGVACGSAEDCWAVGQAPAGKGASSRTVVDATVDGGRRWKAVPVAVPGPADLAAIACAGPRACMAVGSVSVGGADQGLALVTRDSGQRWQAVHAPAGSTDLVAVTCSAPGRCTVVAGQATGSWVASTGTGGAVWQRLGTLPPGMAGVTTLDCTSTTTCLAAGASATTPGHGTGAVAVTGDGGMTWSAATLPPGQGPLHGLACPTPADCLAVGTTATTTIGVAQGQGEVVASTDGGSTWSAAPPPAAVDDAFGVACGSTSTCAVVGTGWTGGAAPAPTGSVAASQDGGGTWRPASDRYLPAGLVAVACPAPVSCVAAGNDELARITLAPAPHHHGAAG